MALTLSKAKLLEGKQKNRGGGQDLEMGTHKVLDAFRKTWTPHFSGSW